MINDTRITILDEFSILFCLMFWLQQCPCLNDCPKNTCFCLLIHKQAFVNVTLTPRAKRCADYSSILRWDERKVQQIPKAITAARCGFIIWQYAMAANFKITQKISLFYAADDRAEMLGTSQRSQPCRLQSTNKPRCLLTAP